MREKEFRSQREKLTKILAEPLQAVKNRLLPLNRVADIVGAYRRLLADGKSPSWIAARLKMPKPQLEFMASMIEQTVAATYPPPLAELALQTATVREVAQRYNLPEDQLRASLKYIHRIGLDPTQIPNFMALGKTVMGG